MVIVVSNAEGAIFGREKNVLNLLIQVSEENTCAVRVATLASLYGAAVGPRTVRAVTYCGRASQEHVWV